MVLALLVLAGCAEGPFWRAGAISPWARKQWSAEEQIADTLFERKRKMDESVAAVTNQSTAQQEPIAEKLRQVVLRDPILLLRLHAVKRLADLNCPTAIEALRDASTDPNPDVRIAAVKSWERMPAEVAIPQLQEIIGSDTHVDVRLAATRSLGQFTGQSAVRALAMALSDDDPAIQVRAMDSLARATGERFGRDVRQWQAYVGQVDGVGAPVSSLRTANHQVDDTTSDR